MRTLALLCLLGLAASARQKAATKQQDDSSGDDTGDAVDTDAGYANAVDTGDYEAPVAYAHVEVRQPAICYTGQCSHHAPCFNRATGTCAPKACASHVVSYGYAAPVSYGDTADAGYTAGGDGEGGAEEDGRRLQYSDHSAVAYGGDFRDEGYPVANRPHCGCPAGTEDTHDWSMHSQTVLWVGFGLLFAPCLCFWWKAFNDLVDKNTAGANRGTSTDESTEVRINAGMVNLVASLAYLAMATKHGFTTRCNGRDFYYARYVDWIITTPLMLWDLAIVAGTDSNSRYFLVFLDIFMIVSGLVGSLVEDSGAGLGGTNEKWGFFGMAMLAFIPILWYLCRMTGKTGQNLTAGFQFCGSFNNGDRRERAYQRAMNLTVISWIVYPIIWIVAEGTENLSVNGENIAYTVLDIISKSVFGWVLVYSQWEVTQKAGQVIQDSSML